MGIRIELANPNGSYFAGEIVKGRVLIHNPTPDEVKEVTISLEGKGQVYWTKTEGRRTLQFLAQEAYACYRSSLIGNGENSIILPAGTTCCPFQFPLPGNLPSTFKSQTGTIAYQLKGEVRRALFRFNDNAELSITVNGILDLNLEIGARVPQHCQKSVEPNFCMCRKGQLNLLLSLPNKSGYVPGEEIDVKIEMTNESNQDVTGVKVSLLQIMTYYAEGKSKTVRKLISEIRVRGTPVEEGECKVWGAKLGVPDHVPPTGLGGSCNIIGLQYFVRFEVEVTGVGNSVTGMLPVVIGNVPFVIPQIGE